MKKVIKQNIKAAAQPKTSYINLLSNMYYEGMIGSESLIPMIKEYVSEDECKVFMQKEGLLDLALAEGMMEE